MRNFRKRQLRENKINAHRMILLKGLRIPAISTLVFKACFQLSVILCSSGLEASSSRIRVPFNISFHKPQPSTEKYYLRMGTPPFCCGKLRARGTGHRAKGKGHRAEGKEHRAEGKGQGAGSRGQKDLQYLHFCMVIGPNVECLFQNTITYYLLQIL
jgi:hypothetical protein